MPTAIPFTALGKEFGLPNCNRVDVDNWVRYSTLSGYTGVGQVTQQDIDDSLIQAHKLLYNLYSLAGTAEYVYTDTSTNPDPNAGTESVSGVTIELEPRTAVCSLYGRTALNSVRKSTNNYVRMAGGASGIVQMYVNDELIGFGGSIGSAESRLPWSRCSVSLTYGQPTAFDNTDPQRQRESANTVFGGMGFTSIAFGRSLFGSLPEQDTYTIALDAAARTASVDAERDFGDDGAIVADTAVNLTGGTEFYTY